MEREDYVEPNCVLCGKPGETDPIQSVDMGRVLDKLKQYEEHNDREGAGRHLRYWLAEAELYRDERAQLTLNNELMGYYRMGGDGERAMKHSRRALELVQRLKMEQQTVAGTTWLNSGTVRVAFGQEEEALHCFEQARENYERNLNPKDERLGGLYNNMGLCLTALGRYGEAETLFYKALQIMRSQPNGELEQAITWLNLADNAAAWLGEEEAEEKTTLYLERASALLDTESLPRNGYYAFVCDKCAPVFGHYGFFLKEAELRERVKEIHERA